MQSIWAGRADGSVIRDEAADEPHYAASLVKLPIAIAAQVLDLSRRVPVHADFDSVVPGRRFTLAEADDQDPETWASLGGKESLQELVRRSLVLSGNLAADLVLEQTGPVDGITRAIGDTPAAEAGLTNTVTARGFGQVLLRMPRPVEDLLLGQTHRDGIPDGLPRGTVVANKTGWIDEVTHDAALVRPADAEPFALVVLTRDCGTTDQGYAAIAAVARQVWERR